MKVRIGVSEKKAKIYFWCRTHHHFCVFRCRASFSPLRCGFLKENNFEKTLLPEGSDCFHPNTPIMRKPKKYIDSSRLAISIRPPEGSRPKAAQKPTHIQKRAAKTRSRRSNIRTEQSRKDNPKMTTRIDKKQARTHQKHHTSRNTKKELEQRRQRIQRMQAQE